MASPPQNDWNHLPPSSLPWGLYSQPRVTKFSGETLSFSKDDSWSLSNKPQKRKMENFADCNTRKQLITEERISADLSQLSINTISSTSADHLEHLSSEKMDDNIVLPVSKMKINVGAKLVLSEELRRLQQEPCIPTSLLEQHLKPCMAVVLWQPRCNVMTRSPSRTRTNQELRNGAENIVQENNSLQDDSNNNEPINNNNLDRVIPSQDGMEVD